MKINFTKEHYTKMQQLLLSMLMLNLTIRTRLGGELNAVELLHTTTINTLNNIRIELDKSIKTLENQDEWVAGVTNQLKLQTAKDQRELVNLIIGYKRYKLEQEENKREKEDLTTQLIALKESQKTPEDKIKELETRLSLLDDSSDF